MNTSVASGLTSVNGAANASANEITNKVYAVMNNVTTSTTGGTKQISPTLHRTRIFRTDVRNDGYVDIIFAGSDGSSMIDDITLNIDAGEIGKGAIIKQLWAKNANVNLAKGSLDIEKLAVENEAHFDVNGMTTSVWGVPPKRNGSNSSYWFNVAAWKHGGDWMNLAFSEKQGIQHSNGVLLDLHNYFYVYNQRFTAVDHMNQLLAENKADEYDINFNPEVVRYFRYDLYDLEQELDENAALEEVIVEA